MARVSPFPASLHCVHARGAAATGAALRSPSPCLAVTPTEPFVDTRGAGVHATTGCIDADAGDASTVTAYIAADEEYRNATTGDIYTDGVIADAETVHIHAGGTGADKWTIFNTDAGSADGVFTDIAWTERTTACTDAFNLSMRTATVCVDIGQGADSVIFAHVGGDRKQGPHRQPHVFRRAAPPSTPLLR